jgi:glycerol-3-phosphate dehydrogenase
VVQKTDILIIGGGVAGCSVARELSRYDVDVTLVEKEADVGWGQSKASYAVCHPGVRWAPGSVAQKMLAQSHQIMDRITKELDIELRRCGELILAFTREDLECLKAMKKNGERTGVQGLEIIDNGKIQDLEPNANPAAMAALYLPTAGVFNPFELVFAFFENARENGVKMLLDTEVTGISPEGRHFIVETTGPALQAGHVVNAAGLHAARIARMLGTPPFSISYETKSSCLILDNCVGDVVQHVITGIADPKAFTRFKLVMPTYHGNLLLYTPIPEPAQGIDDRAVEERIFDRTLETAELLVPGIDFKRHIIASFSGLTARNDRRDFIIQASEKHPALIHVALPPPGITCSPVIGKRVVQIMKERGLPFVEKPDFNPSRKGIQTLRDSSPTEIRQRVHDHARCGRVVCRCEKVSEGEIIEAIRRGATTLDGIKFRVRAGAGRCQANFCGPELASILAKALNQPLEKVTKKGAGSPYVLEKERAKHGE